MLSLPILRAPISTITPQSPSDEISLSEFCTCDPIKQYQHSSHHMMSEVLPDPPVPGAWDSSWDTPVSHSSDSATHATCSTRLRPSSSNPQGGSGTSSRSRARGREDPTPKPPTRESVKRPIVIAVFGQTGTGKTSFIKAVTGQDLKVGHSLTSCQSFSLPLYK